MMKTKFYALLFFLTVAMSGCDNEYDDTGIDFLENVLVEVMELFPSHYIHIGGDECPKKAWKKCIHCQTLMKKEGLPDEEALQSWFIHKIEQFVNSRGRDIIGWDEINDTQLSRIQFARNGTNGNNAQTIGMFQKQFDTFRASQIQKDGFSLNSTKKGRCQGM